jgi:pimeloyl-ACP methyl ester carboxylesterase
MPLKTIALAGLCLLLYGQAAPAASRKVPRGIAVPGTPLEMRQVKDRLGRIVDYYVNRPAAPAPLLLMIQGSGCNRVIQGSREGSSYATLFNLLPYAKEGRFTVLAVEKPFSGRVTEGASGTANGCSEAFKRDFTAQSWLEAVEAALREARRLPWVDGRRTLVIGHSEGAAIAALLAARDDRVTDVVSLAGSGTGQLFDFIARSYQQCFDRSACLAELETEARAIAAKPDSASDFAWGHPYKRWSSFFRLDPAAELLKSRARLYMAFGTADESVPPLSQEILVAKLLGAGRDVTIRRIPDAGHNLMPVGAADWSLLDKEYRAALDWFWAAAPTGLPKP